ncbi:MAG: hypothetical protein ABSD48_11160 [Armatimonadota bacterium]|jgi:hypothetical protein
MAQRSTEYPLVKCFGRFPDNLRQQFVELVSAKEPVLSAIRNAKDVQSRDVASILKDGLAKLGFEFYVLARATEGKSYQFDALNRTRGVAVEVEKGRVILGNQIYLDLFRFHVIPEVKHAVVILPSVSREETEQPFEDACGIAEVVFSSRERRLGFESLLLIGY